MPGTSERPPSAALAPSSVPLQRRRRVAEVRHADRVDRVERAGDRVEERAGLVEEPVVEARRGRRRRRRALAQRDQVLDLVGPRRALLEPQRLDHDVLDLGRGDDVGDEGDRVAGAELVAHLLEEVVAVLVAEEAAADHDAGRRRREVLEQARALARHVELGERPLLERADRRDVRDLPAAEDGLDLHERSTPWRRACSISASLTSQARSAGSGGALCAVVPFVAAVGVAVGAGRRSWCGLGGLRAASRGERRVENALDRCQRRRSEQRPTSASSALVPAATAPPAASPTFSRGPGRSSQVTVRRRPAIEALQPSRLRLRRRSSRRPTRSSRRCRRGPRRRRRAGGSPARGGLYDGRHRLHGTLDLIDERADQAQRVQGPPGVTAGAGPGAVGWPRPATGPR